MDIHVFLLVDSEQLGIPFLCSQQLASSLYHIVPNWVLMLYPRITIINVVLFATSMR